MNNSMYLTKFNNDFMFLFPYSYSKELHAINDLNNDISFHDNVIAMS